MLIATIRSRIMERVAPNLPAEGGFFELAVEVDEFALNYSGRPKELIKTAVAQHLAQCIKETGVPLGEGVWTVTFTDKVKKRTNLQDFVV